MVWAVPGFLSHTEGYAKHPVPFPSGTGRLSFSLLPIILQWLCTLLLNPQKAGVGGICWGPLQDLP